MIIGNHTHSKNYWFGDNGASVGDPEYATPKYASGIGINFKLVIFKKQQTWEQFWKPSRNYTIVRHIYIDECSLLLEVCLPLYQEKEDEFLETLISGEGRDLNMHNNLILVYCFSWRLP